MSYQIFYTHEAKIIAMFVWLYIFGSRVEQSRAKIVEMVKFNPETNVWECSSVKYPFHSHTFMGEEILRNLKETPDRVAQIFHEANYELTCDDLRISSVRVAQNLTKLGIGSGDVVGVICRNSNEVTFLVTGCILIGAPFNPLDVTFNKDDIKHLFGQTLPKLVVCDLDIEKVAQEALRELKNECKVIVIDVEGENSTFNDLLKPTGTEEEFIAPKFVEPADCKTLAIMCSSGSTGSPKGVILTHAVCLMWKVSIIPERSPPSVNLSFSPIFWVSGLIQPLFLAFNRNDVRIMPRNKFSVPFMKDIFNKHKITHLTYPPMSLALTLQSDFAATSDHSSLQTVTAVGSITSAALRQKFSETFPGKDLAIIYAMTEVAITTTYPGEFKKEFAVGSRTFPNVSFKIIDEENQRLGINEPGEILAKPPVKFQGYFNNSEATKNALDDEGYFHTGDIGHIDETGCLFVVDRKKEVLKCKSYQIHLSEIENVIESIEGIETVSVVGIPDDIATNLPAAVIVKRPGFERVTEQFVADYVAARLPFYKHLDAGVYFVDKIPISLTGKIKKRIVVDIVKEQMFLRNRH